MKRLTTNKDVQEMTMIELAHNCCYAKDRKARYRDFEMDMDARDFARNLITTLTGDDLPTDDNDFDEEIWDDLQYDPFESVTGLIALFYRNLWAMADLRETLKSYEDAEEQGLLHKAPLKNGTPIWHLTEGFDEGAYLTETHYIYNVTEYEIGELGKDFWLSEEEAELELANRQQSHAEAIMDERNKR